MKVKDFLKKVNYGSAKLPVLLQEGLAGERRKVVSFDYANYPYPERERTVCSISLEADKVIVYYK